MASALKAIKVPVMIVDRFSELFDIVHDSDDSKLCGGLSMEEADELERVLNHFDPLISAIDAIVAERDRLDRTGDTQTNICELIEQAAKVAKEAKGE